MDDGASTSSRGGGSVGGSLSSMPSASDEQEGGPSASRDERAAALESKLAKRRPKPKDQAAIKDAHWKRYNDLDRGGVEPVASSTGAGAMPEVGYRLSDSAVVPRNNSVSPAAAPSAASASSSAAAPAAAASPGLAPGINRSRAPPTASQILTGQKRYETPEEAAIRAQRAATFSKPTVQKAQKEASARDEKWRAYQQFEAQAAAKPGGGESTLIVNAPLPFGLPASSSSASPAAPFSPMQYSHAAVSPAPTASSAAASSSAAAPAARPPPPRLASAGSPDYGYFEQQMQYLLAKVRMMPAASVSLLRRILQNVLKGGDTPSEADLKFRKIKLGNPKMQEAVVRTDGALELLMACGFVQQHVPNMAEPSGMELLLVFPERTPLDIAQLAYQELAVFSPTGAA